MIRNQPPSTLMILAAAASYLLGLAATLGLARLGFGGPYVAGFVLTGMTLAISWLLVRWGILLPLQRALTAIDSREILHNTVEIQGHKIVGPLIGKVMNVTHSLTQAMLFQICHSV